MGGVGKRSCLELAAHIAGCEYHYLALDYNQNVSDCEEEFKTILMQCGIDNKPTVLVTSESNTKQVQRYNCVYLYKSVTFPT